MPLIVVIFLLLTIWSTSCAVKHLPLPSPVIGLDITTIKKGEISPFDGTLFSNRYLDDYLQWRCKDVGAC